LPPLSGQTKAESCNKDLSFCWFEDSVRVSGDIWVAQDKSEKSIEVSTEINCLKSLKLCARAKSSMFLGKIVTNADFYQIIRWDSNQITVRGEVDPCETETYLINKLDRTVFLVSAPGEKANTSGCKGILGEPKTVTYKLGHKQRRMRLAYFIFLSTILSACTAQQDKSWLIESYDNSVITVQHEGNTYKARCDVSRSFNNAPSVADPNDVHVFKSCDMAIELVGTSVQPFEGTQKDAEGRIIVMWAVGSTLALRSWRDERTPWREDEFVITSVTKKP